MQKQELSKKEKMSLAVDSEIRELTLFNERGTEIKNAKVEKNESKHLVRIPLQMYTSKRHQMYSVERCQMYI